MALEEKNPVSLERLNSLFNVMQINVRKKLASLWIMSVKLLWDVPKDFLLELSLKVFGHALYSTFIRFQILNYSLIINKFII